MRPQTKFKQVSKKCKDKDGEKCGRYFRPTPCNWMDCPMLKPTSRPIVAITRENGGFGELK